MHNVMWWPLEAPFTPMFCAILGLMLALSWLALGIEQSRRRRCNYRCAGLILLAQANSCRGVMMVLRQVAMTAYPVGHVNVQSGRGWVCFLNRSCPGSHFKVEWLSDLYAQPSDELIAESRRWILHHNREVD